MIALLRGEIVSLKLDQAVIDVQGIGYRFYATANTLAALKTGEAATIHTHLVVKEDSLTLYGFQDAVERDVFGILIGVSGIGPKLGLATLSVFPPEELRAVVANKDEGMLVRIPGVGKKSAQRLLVEIGDKLGPAVASPSVGEPGMQDTNTKEVVQALEQLGWKTNLAQTAVSTAKEEHPQDSIAELLRASLQILGRTHG